MLFILITFNNYYINSFFKLFIINFTKRMILYLFNLNIIVSFINYYR